MRKIGSIGLTYLHIYAHIYKHTTIVLMVLEVEAAAGVIEAVIEAVPTGDC